jgi:hypothetical protein
MRPPAARAKASMAEDFEQKIAAKENSIYFAPYYNRALHFSRSPTLRLFSQSTEHQRISTKTCPPDNHS